MAININAKTDYSYLFSGLSSSTGSIGASSNWLSDYASIKNGSYGKLMKAYYTKAGSTEALTNNSTSKDSAKTLASIQTATDDLKESADALLVKGSKSLFNQVDITTTDSEGQSTTTKGYDTDAIYKAVSNFAKNYNSVIKAADESNTSSIQNRTENMMRATISNSKLLSKVGITLNEDSTLSIDEGSFKKADMNTVKTLFNGNGSYGYQVSAQASLINFAADNESSKSNTYDFSGKYSNTYNAGNLFSSYL